MPFLADKQSSSQRSRPTRSATSKAPSTPGRDGHPILQLQRTLGNQAVLRRLGLQHRAGGTANAGVIQRSPQTSHFGKFTDTAYEETELGADIVLEFEPGAEVDATKIGMVQSIKFTGDGKSILTDPSQESRLVTSGPGEGTRLDRVTPENNPIYGAASLAAGKSLADTEESNAPAGKTPSPGNATYELGYRYDDKGALKKRNAWMSDRTEFPATPNSSMKFEVTALAIEGAQEGTYYGSVQWGWERGADNKVKKIDLALVSQGAPSQGFLAPAAAWNPATARGTWVARNEPTQVYLINGRSFVAAYTIARDTKLTTSGIIADGTVVYRIISVVDGKKAGKIGYIKVSDILDQGDGADTMDLPVPDVHIIDADGVQLNADVRGPWRYLNKIPRGTRVVPTGKSKLSDTAKMPMKWVTVVDGPNTEAAGFVPEAALKKERP